jgi:hypothetical protein
LVIKIPITALADFPFGALDWQQQAACRHANPALFDGFQAGPSERDWRRIGQAQKICRECSVRTECLEFGIQQVSSGVFGGKYLSQGHPVDHPELPYKPQREAL